MSAAADGDANAGYISLGTAPDSGAEFPPAGAQGRVVVSWKGGQKIHKATAAGKNGAKNSATGTKVAEVTVKCSWPDNNKDADAWESALATVSPYGANGKKAWDVSHRYAVLYAATAVMVEDFEGPTPKLGTNEMEATLKLSAWAPPTNTGVGAAAVPVAPVPWGLFAGSAAAFAAGEEDSLGNPILPTTPSVDP